eukprot:346953-Amphidinium_carterae.2
MERDDLRVQHLQLARDLPKEQGAETLIIVTDRGLARVASSRPVWCRWRLPTSVDRVGPRV